jgi:hypothetical protein
MTCSGHWSGTGSDAEFIAGLGAGPGLSLGPQLWINKQIREHLRSRIGLLERLGGGRGVVEDEGGRKVQMAVIS